MRRIIYTLIIMSIALANAQEMYTWTSSQGQLDATFWYVGKGILGLRKDGQIKELKLNTVSVQDLNYILSKRHVMEKSYTVAYQTYMLDSAQNLIKRENALLVNFNVEKIITPSILIAKTADKYFVLNIETKSYQVDKQYKLFIKRIKNKTLATANGTLPVFDGYFDFTKNDYKEMLKTKPQQLLYTVTGTTAAYNDWLKKEKKLETAYEEQNNRQKIKEKLQKEKLANDTKLKKEKTIAKHEQQLLGLKQKLTNWELEYDKLMRNSNRKNSEKRSILRRNITDIKKQIREMEESIKKLKLSQ